MCCNLEHVLGLFPYLRRHQWGGLWPVFHAHSPSWESARKRGQGAHHHRALLQHPGSERVYKRRNTDVRQSQLSSNRQQSLRHVAVSYPGGGRNLGSEESYEGWRITLHGGWTPPCDGREGGTTEYEIGGDTRVWSYTQRWILLEDSPRLHIIGHYQ